jgi:type II secretory ATPase GspE/PulE/Tfp pilus assembly ATPase PilB-like protein
VYQEFSQLGMSGGMVEQIDRALAHPHGMLLVTGPTGSGKTTTLYTALKRLNEPSRNILTIEDPVEIRMPYLRQIQVNSEIGLTFATALRSVLRQDPDVILVGEIRDTETAAIALQAALTGHVVLSTLHTNDAVGAVARLKDYGTPPFVINSAVLGVIAQRLVRRVCKHCVATDHLDPIVRHRFGIGADETGFVHGRGCSRCGHTGYQGRVGLYEFLVFTSEIRRLVESGGDTDLIRRDAVDRGMRLIWEEGLDKARGGETTLAEIAKIASVIDLTTKQAERKVA